MCQQNLQLLRLVKIFHKCAHKFHFFREYSEQHTSNIKDVGDAASIDDAIISIDTRNPWNEFNDDYQIDDLSRTHAYRPRSTTGIVGR